MVEMVNLFLVLFVAATHAASVKFESNAPGVKRGHEEISYLATNPPAVDSTSTRRDSEDPQANLLHQQMNRIEGHHNRDVSQFRSQHFLSQQRSIPGTPTSNSAAQVLSHRPQESGTPVITSPVSRANDNDRIELSIQQQLSRQIPNQLYDSMRQQNNGQQQNQQQYPYNDPQQSQRLYNNQLQAQQQLRFYDDPQRAQQQQFYDNQQRGQPQTFYDEQQLRQQPTFNINNELQDQERTLDVRRQQLNFKKDDLSREVLNQQQFYNGPQEAQRQNHVGEQQRGLNSQQMSNQQLRQSMQQLPGEVQLPREARMDSFEGHVMRLEDGSSRPSPQHQSTLRNGGILEFDNRRHSILLRRGNAMYSSVHVPGFKNLPILPAMVYNAGHMPMVHAATFGAGSLHKGTVQQHLQTPYVRYVYGRML